VVALSITAATAFDSKSLEALHKAVFEFSGGDASLKADMSQFSMQLHACGDGQLWGLEGERAGAAPTPASFAAAPSAAAARPRSATVGIADAAAAASTHTILSAAGSAVQHQMVLYALVFSGQTVRALRDDSSNAR
jgi:hypothetical protein